MSYISQVKIGSNTYDLKDKRADKSIPSIPDLNNVISSLFEKGSMASGNDDSYLSDKRVRTPIIRTMNPFQIIPKDQYAKYLVAYFNDAREYVSESTWYTTSQYVPANACFRLLLWVDNSSTSLTKAEIVSHYDFLCDSFRDDFEHGAFYHQTGDDYVTIDDKYRYGVRIRSKGIIHNDVPIHIIMNDSDSRCMVHYFNSNGTYKSNAEWAQHHATIPADSYYRLVFDYKFSGSDVFYSIDEIVSTIAIIESFNDGYINVTKYLGTPSFEKLFVRGTVNNDTMAVDAWHANSRITSPVRFICDGDLYIDGTESQMSVSTYDKDTLSRQDTHYWPTKYYIPKNTPFAICMTKDYDADVAATASEILKTFTFKILIENVFGSSPNIIWQCRNVDSAVYPAYSKWYIQAAAHNQYDRVRVNIRKTTDGYYVLIHDNTINNLARNPDGSVIEETVYSDGQTLATLNSYDWGIQFGPKYAGYGVPMLEDACKYAALFNLGLSIETYQTEQNDIDAIYEIMSKYGLLENAIIIPAGQSESYIAACEYWNSKNEYVSFTFGITEDITSAQIERINRMKTGKNTIYAVPATWGIAPSSVMRAIANANGWRLYNSSVMNYNDLINLIESNTGNTLIEANNIYMIKEAVRKYADSQV